MSLIEFMPLVLEKEEEGTQDVHQDVTFVYIKYNNQYRILSILIIVPYRSMHVCEFIHGQKMGNSVIWTAHVNLLNASVERDKLQ